MWKRALWHRLTIFNRTDTRMHTEREWNHFVNAERVDEWIKPLNVNFSSFLLTFTCISSLSFIFFGVFYVATNWMRICDDKQWWGSGMPLQLTASIRWIKKHKFSCHFISFLLFCFLHFMCCFRPIITKLYKLFLLFSHFHPFEPFTSKHMHTHTHKIHSNFEWCS